MSKQAWQCPGCKTWYAPHVEKCECRKDDSVGVGDAPQPIVPPSTGVWVPPQKVQIDRWYIGDPPGWNDPPQTGWWGIYPPSNGTYTTTTNIKFEPWRLAVTNSMVATN